MATTDPKARYAAEVTEEIFRHRAVMFGYIMTQTGSYHDAEDVFQDVCVTICEKYSDFRKGTNFKAWAMAIVRNKLLSHYEKGARSRKLLKLEADIAGELAEHPVWFEEEKPFAEELDALRECLSSLRGKSRLLLLKRYGEGLSCAGVAEALRWSVESVYVALSRLRGALADCVQTRMSPARRD